MAIISIIAVIGKNNELGYKNELLWHLKSDLAHFKKLTMNKKIIMGKKTFESLPKVLENRYYIVLSKTIDSIEYGTVYNDFNKLLDYLDTLDEEVMIIGGQSIYKLFLPYADNLYLTEVLENAKSDVYFPEFNKLDYEQNLLNEVQEDNKKLKFMLYRRRVKYE